MKGLERGNNGGNTADHADRRRCRKEATLQYVKTLNITELEDFCKPINDAGVDFDLKAFLLDVLPYWREEDA